MLHRQQLQRPRVVAEGRRDGGDDVQRGDPAVRDELGHVGLTGVDDREVAGQAVARGGVDEPLQARLERHGRDDRHHGQPEPDDGRRGPDPARGPRTAPRQPDPRQHRGPAAERGVTARRQRGDGPAPARDDSRRPGRHRDEQQRENHPTTQGDGPRRPEPRCRLEPGLAAQRLDQPGGEGDHGAGSARGERPHRTGQHPRHRALGERHPQCALDALDVAAAAVVAQQPLRDDQQPAQPDHDAEHDQPREQDRLGRAHRRVDAGGRERRLGRSRPSSGEV